MDHDCDSWSLVYVLSKFSAIFNTLSKSLFGNKIGVYSRFPRNLRRRQQAFIFVIVYASIPIHSGRENNFLNNLCRYYLEEEEKSQSEINYGDSHICRLGYRTQGFT